jgi:mono/diheme cytochrome c family protein
MKIEINVLIMLVSLISLTASAADRRYDDKLVVIGSQLFQQNCAVCHGVNAGHHSIPQLARSIKEDGIQLGGVMPSFDDQLDDQQILALSAYSQSKWPDEIYPTWHNRHMQ